MDSSNFSQMPPVFSAPAAPTPNPTPNPAPTRSGANSSLIKTVVIVLLALLFIGSLLLAFYFYSEYQLVRTDVDSQIDVAVANAEHDLRLELEAEFTKRENATERTFAGPVDYGSLSFRFSKLWSVYIEKDASNGGDFVAYLNPDKVDPVSRDTINALRVTISTDAIDRVLSRYSSQVDRGELTTSIITLPTGKTATRYDGSIDGTFVGSVVIFKIRDKTVILQTDATQFREQFDALINTINYNQ